MVDASRGGKPVIYSFIERCIQPFKFIEIKAELSNVGVRHLTNMERLRLCWDLVTKALLHDNPSKCPARIEKNVHQLRTSKSVFIVTILRNHVTITHYYQKIVFF